MRAQCSSSLRFSTVSLLRWRLAASDLNDDEFVSRSLSFGVIVISFASRFFAHVWRRAVPLVLRHALAKRVTRLSHITLPVRRSDLVHQSHVHRWIRRVAGRPAVGRPPRHVDQARQVHVPC